MNLFDHKQPLLDLYNALINDSHDLFSENDMTYFQDAAVDFNQEQFNIVIAGRFSSGKSRLINEAFLQADILPCANEPTICHPVYIAYGEEKQLIAPDANGNRQVIARSDNEVIKNALNQYAAQYSNDRDLYQVFELSWPDADLLKNGVVLIDTIGTEDTEEKYIQQTYHEMERAAAVVFMTGMKQPGTKSEQDLIEQYLANTGKKLFLVLTKADQLEPNDQEIVRKDFCQRFSPFFAKHGIHADRRVFVTSAKTGKEQGLPELRQALLTFVANDRFKALLFQHTQQLSTKLQAEQKKIETYLKDYQNKKAGDERSIREAREKMRQFQQDLASRELDLEDMKSELIEEAKINLTDEIAKLKRHAKQELKDLDRKQLKTEAQEQLNQLAQLVDSVASRLQLNMRKQMQQRLQGSMTNTDFDELESRLNSINESALLNVTKFVSGVGSLAGVTAVFAGTLQGIAAGTSAASAATAAAAAAAAQVAQAGAIATWYTSAATYLFGSATAIAPTVATPAITIGLGVAVPFIVGGAAVAGIGYFAYKQIDKMGIDKYRQSLIDALNELIKVTEKESKQNFKVYVDEQVTKCLNDVKKDISKQLQQLDDLIAEKDLTIMDQQIECEKVKQQAIQAYLQTLKTLQPA